MLKILMNHYKHMHAEKHILVIIGTTMGCMKRNAKYLFTMSVSELCKADNVVDTTFRLAVLMITYLQLYQVVSKTFLLS